MTAQRPLSVLVVEGGGVASATAELLRRGGHAVRTAASGPGALLAAAADPPDAAVLDLDLPGMDGWELAGRLRPNGGRRPFLVALSARGDEDDRRRSAGAGIDLHLVRPVEPGLLLWAVRRAGAPAAPVAPAPVAPVPEPAAAAADPAPIRVVLADDHAVVREGLKSLLRGDPGLEVVGEAGDGLAAVRLAADLTPDVLVVDVSMPGLSGAQVTARVREARPSQKVLALTVHEDEGYMRQLIAAGATGYVFKRAASADLVRAVRAVAGGGTYLDPRRGGGAVVEPDPAGSPAPAGVALSEREAEVVRLIATGYSNKEIAARLKLSVKTVETYKTRSMEKLGMRSRVDIVRFAVQSGWLAAR